MILPERRSRQMARQDLFAVSVVETKTKSPQTQGVLALGPGRSILHKTFSVSLNCVGRFFSSVEPLKNGPRNCGQSPA